MVDKFWKGETGGIIPDGAIEAGSESNGDRLYICRARHAGGVHPGKIRFEFGGCNIPYGGKEIRIRSYEVLVFR